MTTPSNRSGPPQPALDPAPDGTRDGAGRHTALHSEAGARRGEHPGRSRNPVVKAVGLAWLEFEKPDLDRAEPFLLDFGLTVADRTPDTLVLRSGWGGTPCVVVHRGPTSRFVGTAFQAADGQDLERLARATGGTVSPHRGGHAVAFTDPSGFQARLVHGVAELPRQPERDPLAFNYGAQPARTNATQRPVRRPAQVQRLGHVALGTTRFRSALDWYLDHLGLIVSDFLYLDGQRDRGPAMAFIRCDRGSVPSDHHTLAMALMPHTGLLHSAYQLTDLDEVAASGEFLRARGHQHAWGIGRHIQGSQIFDYWQDCDRLMFEHYTDGDLFDASMEPGWAPLSVSGLAQWGPRASARFTGTKDLRMVLEAIKALREKGNEVDLKAVRGLVKAMGS